MIESKVIEIKEALIANKLTQKEIGELHGVSRSIVSDIATGRCHSAIGPSMLPVKIRGGQSRSLSMEEQNVSLIGQLENTRRERSQLKRQLQSSSGGKSYVEGVLESLGDSLGQIPVVKRIPLPRKTSRTIDETLVLVLSDLHLDQIVTPEEVEGLEEFNFIIGARRCEILIESLLRFTQQTLVNFRFKKLVIFGLGDYGSFDLHDQTHESFFGDVFRNTLAIGQLFSAMFSELAPHFESIEVHNITGNHGRLTAKGGYSRKDAAGNYDTLAMQIAAIHCKENRHLNFYFPEGISSIVDVEGYKFHLSHGHTKAGGSAAWNRAKKMSQTVVPLHGGDIDYILQGHYHTSGLVAVSGGATLIGNGALLACDQYSLQALGEASVPSQFIFGVHPQRGLTWRLPIQVISEGEGEGPQRYNLPCLEWEHVCS